jgi:hypothetical protein
MATVDLTSTNTLVTANAAVDATTSATISALRLSTLTSTQTATLNATPVTVGPLSTKDIIDNFNNLSGASSTTSSTAGITASKVGITQPINYKFNLPPHNWSLPLRPTTVDPETVGHGSDLSFHGLRRGRLWYWVGANNMSPTTVGTGASGAPLNIIDTSWGFQFLWNPTSISTSVARNMDITPSSADTLRVVAGVFPGQETVSINIVIDRTNDFACIRAAAVDASLDLGTGILGNGTPIINNLNAFTKYYTSLYPGADPSQDMTQQINNLMTQGTMADLEYFFKAINGSGNGNIQWTNLLGKKTANVGYLAPTLLGIQLGPTLDNLSYVGWASNISINHTAFTENMIPIRTEVSISIQCFAGSGLTSGV